MHKQRMINYEIPYSKCYEDEVIYCILKRIGIEQHPHALEEVGMCQECDAAALLSMVKEKKNNPPADFHPRKSYMIEYQYRIYTVHNFWMSLNEEEFGFVTQQEKETRQIERREVNYSPWEEYDSSSSRPDSP